MVKVRYGKNGNNDNVVNFQNDNNKKENENMENEQVVNEVLVGQSTIDGTVEQHNEVKETHNEGESEMDITQELLDELDEQAADNKVTDELNEKLPTYERETPIQNNEVRMTVRDLVREYGKGLLKFDLTIQRNKVWKDEQKGKFIHTILYGFPFPPVYAIRNFGLDTSCRWFLDGKQRLTTVIEFVQGEFALHKETPDVFGYELANKTFNQLDEQFQEKIKDSIFNIQQMENLTKDEIDEMFLRLNNGSALSQTELTRVYAGGKVMDEVKKIGDHDFFAHKVNLTDTARLRYTDQSLILQVMMHLTDWREDFGSLMIRKFAVILNKAGGINEDLKKEMNDLTAYVHEATNGWDEKLCDKALKKIHIPSLFVTARKAIVDGTSASEFGLWTKSFLSDDYKNQKVYKEAVRNSTHSVDNNKKRVREMEQDYRIFMANRKLEQKQA